MPTQNLAAQTTQGVQAMKEASALGILVKMNPYREVYRKMLRLLKHIQLIIYSGYRTSGSQLMLSTGEWNQIYPN
jgi:hypothetical protein